MWNKIKKENLFFVVVDLQEKFYPLIKAKVLKQARNNVLLTINMFKKLEIPMIGTEHYVKGLGPTDKEILNIWEGEAFTDKVTFSCLKDDSFNANLSKFKKPVAVVCGLETHICVLQTVIDLIDQNFEVIVLKDACVSSTKLRWENGMQLMEKAGAHILNTETLLFYLLQKAGTPEFKYMVSLIKDAQSS